METIDYKKLFEVGAEITLSSDFISRTYSSTSWEQDCINIQKKCGSLKIKHVYSGSILVEGTRSNWQLTLHNINLYQLEPYKENSEILYAFANNQARENKKRNISTALSLAFSWKDTPEGSGFWISISTGKYPKYPEFKEPIETSKENQQETIQNNNSHEIRLQKQKALVVRGTRPKGGRICSSKHKASIRSRQISYTACHC